MDDTRVYLDKLTVFARLLRNAGIRAGTESILQAAGLLTEIGLSDRALVKTALRTVFASSLEEQKLFDSVFDGFFLPEEAIREQMEKDRAEAAQKEAEREQARRELEDIGDAAGLDEQQQASYTELPEEARQKLLAFLERYRANMERSPTLYSEFIHSVFARSIMEQQLLMENAGENRLASDPDVGILYKELSAFQDNEIPKAVETIARIARQLNGELSARKKACGRSSVPDFRKTIRKGLETGGVLYRLSYKRKPVHRKKLILLCDVSGSMIQFSEFALRFILSLNQVSDNSRVFLFSETLLEAGAFRLQNMDTFRDFIRQSGIYGRGTDLGAALSEMMAIKPVLFGTGSLLLILSDTKTIDRDRAVRELLAVKKRAARVLWLNPIPAGKWQYLTSVRTVQELVPMICCSTLTELAQACRKLTEL